MSLTPYNELIMKENAVEKLRQEKMLQSGGQFCSTPSTKAVLNLLEKAIHDLVVAEEYDHPVLSKEVNVEIAEKRIELVLMALKESIIVDVKTERGEWVAVA